MLYSATYLQILIRKTKIKELLNGDFKRCILWGLK